MNRVATFALILLPLYNPPPDSNKWGIKMPAHDDELVGTKKKVTASTQWHKPTRNKTRAIYGGVVGAAVVFVAYRFGVVVIADGNLSLTEALFIAGLALFGLVAALPGTFMPFIYEALTTWQDRKGGGE